MKTRNKHRQDRRAPQELDIESLGAQGDGIARLDGRLVYVPLALPGDRVRVSLEAPRGDGLAARLLDIIGAGPARVSAPCGQFGQCGGCALQHLRESEYADWKIAQLRSALSRRGLNEVAIGPLVRVPPGTRRRAALAAERSGTMVRLGFNARGSHRIVDATGCLVLTRDLAFLLPQLRSALATVLAEGTRADVTATVTESGIDLAVTSRQALSLSAREALASLADRADLARLTWQGDPIVIRRTPRATFGGVPVDLPPAAFLQPTEAGEAVLTTAVMQGLAECGTVADLYAGCGTFTFPLARRSRIHAVEGEEQALHALTTAARRAGLSAQVSSERRDLARDPLTADELNRFDGVLFDPPRAGAKTLSGMLARSAVPTVVAVSCDPATFARDARILVDGGYRIGDVTPIDQFIWSPHLELAATFRR